MNRVVYKILAVLLCLVMLYIYSGNAIIVYASDDNKNDTLAKKISKEEIELFERAISKINPIKKVEKSSITGIDWYLQNGLPYQVMAYNKNQKMDQDILKEHFREWFKGTAQYAEIQKIREKKINDLTDGEMLNQKKYVSADLDVLEFPNSNAAVVGHVSAGELVVLQKNIDVWCLIEWGNQRGYILSKYLLTKNSTIVESSEYEWLSPKAGNYISFIDRLNYPDYAYDFYEWLVENSVNNPSKDSPLIDVTKGEKIGSQYYYKVATISGELIFPLDEEDGNVSKNVLLRKVIKESIQRSQDTINATKNMMANVLNSVFIAFQRDYPKVFWFTEQATFSSRNVSKSQKYDKDRNVVIAKYSFDMYLSLSCVDYSTWGDVSNILKMVGEINEILEKVISDIPDNSTREEKVRYINKWITHNNSYGHGEQDANARECTSALLGMEGTSRPVCVGYAHAFKVLCDEVGVPCVLVAGLAGSPCVDRSWHRWNYVQMEDDQWYAVDVTWNDPSGSSEKISGKENEDWLLLGSKSVVKQDGSTFGDYHIAEQGVARTNIDFGNGPVLSEQAWNGIK